MAVVLKLPCRNRPNLFTVSSFPQILSLEGKGRVFPYSNYYVTLTLDAKSDIKYHSRQLINSLQRQTRRNSGTQSYGPRVGRQAAEEDIFALLMSFKPAAFPKEQAF